jgi:phage replication O-like protein O
MANPQLENGHIRIANEIVEEALCKTNLSAYESRILWFILRKTYGWNKKSDRISYTQFEETGITRRHIARTLCQLKNRNIITVSGNGQRLKYSFQKDYTKWDGNIKGRAHSTITNRGNGQNHYLKGDKPLPIGVTKPLPIGVNTKDNKDTNKRQGRKQVSSSSLENKQVREVFAALKERRGYENPNPGAEARAMRWMLQHGYTPSEILGCYDYLKAQPFWQDKPLTMMSVKGQIGEWQNNKSKQQSEEWRMR